MGLSFTVPADPRQRGHSRVRAPRDSWPYFTISDSRLPQPGGPGLRIYMPQESKVTLWLTVSKSWCRASSRAHDQKFITVWQWRSWWCGAPSLTIEQICLLYMLLALASAVFLGSESLGIRDHILLSQIWDFPFRPLLRLKGSQWRYSDPPPNGLSAPGTKSKFQVTLRLTVSQSVKSW
jgi:hypothetical protein